MAIYDLIVQTIKRSQGRSAVAASAYRGGGRLLDERTQIVHDYTRRRGICSELMLPDRIATPLSGPLATLQQARERLWNKAEQAEKRGISVVAREVRVAIPIELSQAQGRALVRRFAKKHLVNRHKVVAEIAFHEAPRSGDPRNRHAHIQFTVRRIEDDLSLGPKTRQFDDRQHGSAIITSLRRSWSAMANAALRLAGSDQRISYKSLERLEQDLATGHHLKLPAGQPRRTDFVPNAKRGSIVERRLRKARDKVAHWRAIEDGLRLEILAEAWPVAPIEEIRIVDPVALPQAWLGAGDQINLAEAERKRTAGFEIVAAPTGSAPIDDVKAVDAGKTAQAWAQAGDQILRDAAKERRAARAGIAAVVLVRERKPTAHGSGLDKALRDAFERIELPGRGIIGEGHLDDDTAPGDVRRSKPPAAVPDVEAIARQQSDELRRAQQEADDAKGDRKARTASKAASEQPRQHSAREQPKPVTSSGASGRPRRKGGLKPMMPTKPKGPRLPKTPGR